MPKFKVRAQWRGPNGAQVGVADDTVEANDACEVLDHALPGTLVHGKFTHATITIEPVSEQQTD